ncbi:unnamed protein product, partial [Mesorhabditis spiculigera]
MSTESSTVSTTAYCYTFFYLDVSNSAEGNYTPQFVFAREMAARLYNTSNMHYQATAAIYGSDNEDNIDLNTMCDDFGTFSDYLNDFDLTAPNNDSIMEAVNELNGKDGYGKMIIILFTASPPADMSSAAPNKWQDRTVGIAIEDVVFNFALPGGPLDIGYATDSLSSWAVQDVVVVLFTGSDPSKFPAAAQNYTRKSMTVGVAVGAQTSVFAAISVKAMQPATIYQAALSLCQPNNGFSTAQPSPTVNTVSTTTTTSLPTCKALFVADLSDSGRDWFIERSLIRASVAALFDVPSHHSTVGASQMLATESLSSWSVHDVVIVLFTGSDPKKFPDAGRNYPRKSMTVGVAVGADTSAFAIIPIPFLQPLTIIEATVDLCRTQQTSTPAPMPTYCTTFFYLDMSNAAVGQYHSQISFADAVAAKLFSISKLNFEAGAAIYGSDNEGAPDLRTLFDDFRLFSDALRELDLTAPNDESIIDHDELAVKTPCHVLFVADLSDRAPATQTQTIIATMNELFTGAAANGINVSMAYWRYSRGGELDGPIPTTFVYRLQDLVLNFGLQGGQLDIGYATDMLSDWSVEDAVIVLFTGSDPHKFRDAGWNYTRRPTTIGVADGADTRAFAVLPVPYLHPIAIYDATIQLCRTAVPTRAPPTTTTILTTTPVDYRARCSVAFWLDASYEAWKYDGGAFLFQASVWILGQGMGAPTLNTLETNFASFDQTLQGLDRLLKVTKADNSTIATTVGFINSQPFYPHITLFFTNSNQAEIDASPENAYRSSSYGYDFTPVNLMRLANSISDPPAAGMVDVIDNYCRKIHQN